MSTFFEKLTGVRPRPVPADDPPPRSVRPQAEQALARPQRAPTSRRPEQPPVYEAAEPSPVTHLKVESAERPQHFTEPEPEPPEEEGELTVDIYDKGDAIVIQSTVAGVKPEDLDVSITSDSVAIRGRRECSDQVPSDDYYYKELFWGTFSRSIILPEEIEDDMAEASLKHGLLTVRLPKRRRGVVQKLKVKSV